MKQIRRKKTMLCSLFNHKPLWILSDTVLSAWVIHTDTTTLWISAVLVEAEAVADVRLQRFRTSFRQIRTLTYWRRQPLINRSQGFQSSRARSEFPPSPLQGHDHQASCWNWGILNPFLLLLSVCHQCVRRNRENSKKNICKQCNYRSCKRLIQFKWLNWIC